MDGGEHYDGPCPASQGLKTREREEESSTSLDTEYNDNNSNKEREIEAWLGCMPWSSRQHKQQHERQGAARPW